MAVQQNKKSPSKRNMRRSHDAISAPALSTSTAGITHLRHHIDANGMYRGKKILKSKDE